MEYKKGYVFGINDEYQYLFQKNNKEMKKETKESKQNPEEEKEVQRFSSQ